MVWHAMYAFFLRKKCANNKNKGSSKGDRAFMTFSGSIYTYYISVNTVTFSSNQIQIK